MWNVCVCVWQLYKPVDRISSSVMMETVSWAADSVMASEIALMDQTKSTAKTVCAACVCTTLQMAAFNFPEGDCSLKKRYFSYFELCISVCRLHIRLSWGVENVYVCGLCGHVNGHGLLYIWTCFYKEKNWLSTSIYAQVQIWCLFTVCDVLRKLSTYKVFFLFFF